MRKIAAQWSGKESQFTWHPVRDEIWENIVEVYSRNTLIKIVEYFIVEDAQGNEKRIRIEHEQLPQTSRDKKSFNEMK